MSVGSCGEKWFVHGRMRMILRRGSRSLAIRGILQDCFFWTEVAVRNVIGDLGGRSGAPDQQYAAHRP